MTGPTIRPAPPTRRDDLVERRHGVDVADPYRWLEDGDDPDVRQWVAAQNDRTRELLDGLDAHAAWRSALEPLFAAPVVAAVDARGGRIVTMERAPGDEQFVLVARSADAPDAPGVRLVDPSVLLFETC